MEDLYTMMEGYHKDAYEREEGFDPYITNEQDEFFADGLSSQQLGMVLGLAEMMAEENASTEDPARLFEDYRDSRAKLNLQDRNHNKAPMRAFDKHVHKKCGI
jgi:hypothetical protein